VVYSGTRWYAGPPPGRVAQEVGHPVHPVSVTPPAPGIVQPVHVGTPAGVASSGPSVRPAPGSPAAAPPGAHFNPGAGWGPSHGQAVGGTAVSPAPPPRMQVQPGSPVGVPAAPYPFHSGGAPVPAAPQPGPGPGAPGGIRMQPGWGGHPQAPSPMPAAPPPGRSGAPAPHGQFMNPEPPRTMPVGPAPPTYHSVPYPEHARMSPPAQAAPVRDHGPAMQQSMRYESPAIPRGAPVMNQAPVSHPGPVAPAPGHGGGVAAHPWTSKFR
jgi:hypothetical protein